ncbi:metallophosphoesterase family protein [Polyangium aurulentum]|uniref:metallophosphoesterase family protein n=1 Tax=Polyangium aurulentum TaxID=2567896 RepID=UPI0010AE9AB0|nr:metallophosphoesterase [Polyangium aurulentum]UQA56072.1 metallophosphoesterase [Polyangium aurulentum]
MRIAHLSDLHLLSFEGVMPKRFLNKRLTGYLNIRYRRKAVHKPFAVEAAAREIRDTGIDHVVITGDVSNLALEVEFELVRLFLERDLGLHPDQVSMVPGNHDTYTHGAFRTGRFMRYFEAYLKSDLSEVPGPFPFVHLRGPAAIIGLSTAVPRPPLVASGSLKRPQLEALSRLLSHPEVRKRTLVVLQHHPWHNPPSTLKTLLEGLYDARAEHDVLRKVPRGLLLHGHLHRRIHRQMTTDTGHIDTFGATSASLLDERTERMAGFNVYELDDAGGLVAATSHGFDPTTKKFREVPIPRA